MGYYVIDRTIFSKSFFTFYLRLSSKERNCDFVLRYMDDLIILSESKDFLHNLLGAIKIYLKIELDLVLKNSYKIFPVD